MTNEGEPKKKDRRGPRATNRPRAKGAGSALAPAVNEIIGRRLESHYRALTTEPLPDRFVVLLAELRAKELKK